MMNFGIEWITAVCSLLFELHLEIVSSAHPTGTLRLLLLTNIRDGRKNNHSSNYHEEKVEAQAEQIIIELQCSAKSLSTCVRIVA